MRGSPGGRIMIVDDDASAVRVLSAILADEGFETLLAASTATARNILKAEDVDVVITDLKMPVDRWDSAAG